jgi:hypothetical protein
VHVRPGMKSDEHVGHCRRRSWVDKRGAGGVDGVEVVDVRRER